jgi:hypothetical protein
MRIPLWGKAEQKGKKPLHDLRIAFITLFGHLCHIPLRVDDVLSIMHAESRKGKIPQNDNDEQRRSAQFSGEGCG